MASPFDKLNLTPESLRGFLIENLSRSQTFTDQIYEGSNISALTDLNSAFTHLMLYYLNQGESQGEFSETEIYENMNRIVKILDYNPLGYQTALINFQLYGQNMLAGTYNIPRFSFVESSGIRYSFNEDITIVKQTDTILEQFNDIVDTKLLYQGTFVEHPSVFAQGLANEKILLSSEDTAKVDHFNIFVFVKDATTGVWKEYERVETLVFERETEEKFEIRLNENLLYELTFGDNLNGKQLNAGDEIAMYYLNSSGQLGEIAATYLNNKKLKVYSTAKLNEILSDIDPTTTYVTEGNNFIFQNDCPSTFFKAYESVDEIRKNAPKAFRGQYKIVQSDEYASFVRQNFGNLIQDSAILSNEEFLTEYFGFYQTIGLFDPLEENRVTQNQLLFGNSCNFNNVYCPIVPKTLAFNNFYIPDHLKKLIKDSIDKQKCTTANFVPIDPIFLNMFLGVGSTTKQEDSYLKIIRTSSNESEAYIRQKLKAILTDYFSLKTSGLGVSFLIQDLNAQILGLSGVSSIQTINTDGVYTKGLQFYYTDLNHPSVIAGTVNTNTDFSSIFCWLVRDLDYIINNTVVV